MGLFGKPPPPDPKEQVKQWSSALRKEGYKLDRQINGIKREEDKVKKSIKDSAKKGQRESCTILAKELIRSRKATSRLYAAKAQMNSVQMQMKNQLAMVRLAGAMEKSTEVMAAMQSLIKLPEISATMMELSKEMTKAGILEEMLDDTLGDALDDDEVEDEAEEEVQKVLFELTQGDLGKAPAAVSDTLPTPVVEREEQEEEEEDLSDMQARLEALKG